LYHVIEKEERVRHIILAIFIYLRLVMMDLGFGHDSEKISHTVDSKISHPEKTAKGDVP